ncbi:MAG: hypothetical protein ACD_10C00337G0002 [uncultured bacterium]|nr:MAG: hypothetical protein ACD_10C00337G0002 [uncultured bacterium]
MVAVVAAKFPRSSSKKFSAAWRRASFRRNCWLAPKPVTMLRFIRSTRSRRLWRRRIFSCRSLMIPSILAALLRPTPFPMFMPWVGRRSSRWRWSACRSMCYRLKPSAKFLLAVQRFAGPQGFQLPAVILSILSSRFMAWLPSGWSTRHISNATRPPGRATN